MASEALPLRKLHVSLQWVVLERFASFISLMMRWVHHAQVELVVGVRLVCNMAENTVHKFRLTC
jgi:hypothetical protein